MSANSQSSAPAATELAVSGLNCNNCARKVTGIIQGFTGVASVTVSLEQERATIRWAANAEGELPKLLNALRDAGYESSVVETNASRRSCGSSPN